MGLGGLEPPTLRLSVNLTEGMIHGKKSSKFNSECTICRSCREMMIGPVVLKQRENRVE